MGWILFFDGDCAFCSASVRRVFRADRRGVFRFAPLQGEFSRRRGFGAHASAETGTMVVMREADSRVFLRSDACVEMARALGWPWRLLALARWIPRRPRDAAYGFLARNRRWLPGFTNACDLPHPDLAKRLLE